MAFIICKECNVRTEPSRHCKNQKFCSHSCSAKFNNRKRSAVSTATRLKIKQWAAINRPPYTTVKYSVVTGRILGPGNNSFWDKPSKKTFALKLCKIFKIEPGIYPATEQQLEYVRQKIKYMYEVEKSSSIQIKEQLNIPLPNGHMPAFLKQLDITRRSLSESASNAIQTGRSQLVNNNNKRYKSGTHVDWTNKLHYYRSNYELEFYKVLDRKQKVYKTEPIRVSYYDNNLKKHRIAIPDIIIGKLLIEIKSNFTFNQANMLDKFNAYRLLGFRPILILEGKVKFLKKEL